MKAAKFCKKHENLLLTAAVLFCMLVFIGIRFDYFYQANDDVYIKNLLSGVYTGAPESHNIQMHYPLSLLISLLYRLAPKLPVYGLFLCICHYGSCGLILHRSLSLLEKRSTRVAVAVLEGFLFTALLMPELVFTQYTVTCALLAAAAAFRFYTQDTKGKTTGAFLKQNIGNILLVVLAYCVRSEMLLLMLPFICVAGFFKWMTERPVFTAANAVRYFSLFGIILAALGVAQVLHMAAYAGQDWKEFTRFFDERTQLYDYQFIPDYEENREFYDSIGLKRSEQQLLVNYNFSLDSKIQSQTLKEVSSYAKGLKTEGASLKTRFGTAFADYKYKLFHEVDFPYNAAVLAAYGILLLFALQGKSYSYLWKLPVCFFVRTGLWMYIILGGRYPDRITHSLYLMEFAVLSAFLLVECKKEKKRTLTVFAYVLLFLLAIPSFQINLQKTDSQMEQREYANREIQALDAYCRQDPDNFYFVDVYSAVSCAEGKISDTAIEYSEKIFSGVDNSLANYDLLGGWVVNSPATAKKLARFGLYTEDGRSAQERGILDRDAVYVIIKKGQPMDWLYDYYLENRKVSVHIRETDAICVDGQEIYMVYQVSTEKEAGQ